MASNERSGGNGPPTPSRSTNEVAQPTFTPNSVEPTAHAPDKLPILSTSIPAAPTRDLVPPPNEKHIWLVTGPAGCGKSTVGEYLAKKLGFPFIEGDSFHPDINKEKMHAGIPLTDADRWDWLTILREEAIRKIKSPSPTKNPPPASDSPDQSNPTQSPNGVVVACSALKRKYRDVFRVAPYYETSIKLHFVYLRASEELLTARVEARQKSQPKHYMPPSMVRSQFKALEEPGEDEMEKDCWVVDVSGGVEDVERAVLDLVRKMAEATPSAEN